MATSFSLKEEAYKSAGNATACHCFLPSGMRLISPQFITGMLCILHRELLMASSTQSFFYLLGWVLGTCWESGDSHRHCICRAPCAPARWRQHKSCLEELVHLLGCTILICSYGPKHGTHHLSLGLHLQYFLYQHRVTGLKSNLSKFPISLWESTVMNTCTKTASSNQFFKNIFAESYSNSKHSPTTKPVWVVCFCKMPTE